MMPNWGVAQCDFASNYNNIQNLVISSHQTLPETLSWHELISRWGLAKQSLSIAQIWTKCELDKITVNNWLTVNCNKFTDKFTVFTALQAPTEIALSPIHDRRFTQAPKAPQTKSQCEIFKWDLVEQFHWLKTYRNGPDNVLSRAATIHRHNWLRRLHKSLEAKIDIAMLRVAIVTCWTSAGRY